MKKLTNQHGDVILEKISELPKNAKKVNDLRNGFILERGEGVHTHELRGVGKELSKVCDVYEDGDIIFLHVKKGESVELDHEEHGVQTLGEGIYKKDIEREFDYEKEVERKVIDQYYVSNTTTNTNTIKAY